MKRVVGIFTLILIGGAVVFAAADTQKVENKKQPLPYMALQKSNKESPHILFVNVDNAIIPDQLDKATGMINALYGFNIWTNSIKKSMITELVSDTGLVTERFGENAVLAVFIEKNSGGYNYLQAPGWWSMVNVDILDKDSPEDGVLMRRIAKVCLRGLAMCCGVGANHDPRCVMYVDGFDLKGMDAVSNTFSPFAYQPMQRAVRKLGTKAPYKKGY